MTDRWDRAIYEILANNSLSNIALGMVPGWRVRRKYGRNPEININSVPEDVWNGGGLYTGQPETDSAEVVTVTSSDAADDIATGEGAHTIRIEGLDDDLLQQTEDIDLSGLTGADSVLAYRRAPQGTIIVAGTTRHNIGEITVTQKITTANKFIVMSVLSNRTAICCDTIPANHTGVLLTWLPSASKGGGIGINVAMELCVRKPGFLFEILDYVEIGTGAPSTNRPLMEILPGGSDWVIRVASTSGNGTAVACTAVALWIDNNFLQ